LPQQLAHVFPKGSFSQYRVGVKGCKVKVSQAKLWYTLGNVLNRQDFRFANWHVACRQNKLACNSIASMIFLVGLSVLA